MLNKEKIQALILKLSFMIAFPIVIVLCHLSCGTQDIQKINLQLKDNGLVISTELSEIKELPSPDGKYAIFADDLQYQQDWDGIHHVYILNKKTNITKKIFEYERSLHAFWSPDSQHICLNYYNLSGEGTCLLLDPFKSISPLDLKNMLEHIATQDKWFEPMIVDRCYVEGVQWHNNCTLDMVVHGQMWDETLKERRNYRLYLRYTFNKGFTKLGKKFEN